MGVNYVCVKTRRPRVYFNQELTNPPILPRRDSVASSLIVWSRHSPHKAILRTRSMISDNGIMVSKSGKIGSTRIIASRTTDL